MSFPINLNSTGVNQQNQQNQYCQNNCNCILKQTKQFDPREAAKEFCNLYYQGMSTKGCSAVLHLFDQNACCNYGGKEYTGFYNVMTAMATEGISKTLYDKLTCTVLPINSEQISLQITGNIQGLTFWNHYTALYTFTEIFILTLKNGNIFVTSYSNKLL